MQLTLDGNKIECVAWKVDAPEGGRVIWRFITSKNQVWRVCLDSRIPAARTMVNTDATEVRVVSLLWPIQELCEIVHAAKTDRQKRDVVRGFLANLLRQFDWRFERTIHALTKVPNGRRDLIGAIPNACDMVQLEVPKGMVKEVSSKVTMLGANPTHTACATFLREFARDLEKTDLMEYFDADWLSLIVKRLALKYDTITPEAEHRAKQEGLRRVWEERKITYPTQPGPCRREGCRRVWEGYAEIPDKETVSDADSEKILLFPRRVTPIKPRFAPLHAQDAESRLFDECKRHAVSDERMDARNADGYAFQSFLRSTEFVAVHNWPDFTLALPVLWVDTEPQEMNGEELKLYGAKGSATSSEKGMDTNRTAKDKPKEILPGWRVGKLILKELPNGRKPAVFKFGQVSYTVPSGKAWETVCTLINESAFDGHGLKMKTPCGFFKRNHAAFFKQRLSKDSSGWFIRIQ